jgi:UDP-N-acetylmuramoylalanine--D-glutamate ligase
MIDVFPFSGFPVAVFGLDAEGLVAAEALAHAEAEVWAWDDDDAARARAEEAGIPLVDLYACDWKKTTTLVVSTAVPFDGAEPHEIVTKARAAGCEVIGDVELLIRTQRDSSYIGVTGTYGKSTTTALIGHIMQTSGGEAEVGGCLGVPVLGLHPLDNGGTYVVGMSPSMLRLTVSLTFDVAVLLNVDSGEADYAETLKMIFHRQTAPRTAVVGVDDDGGRAVAEELRAKGELIVIPVSGLGAVEGGVYAEDGMLHDDTGGKADPVIDLNTLVMLPGAHNWQNAAAAYAATKTAGVEPRVIMACLNSFPGLVHRQEWLATIDGVAYVNDARADSPLAVAKALSSYEDVYWIAGGGPEDQGWEAVEPFTDRVRQRYPLGESAADLARALETAGAAARDDMVEDAVVLLSPGVPPLASFADFSALGDAFRELVDALPGERDDEP